MGSASCHGKVFLLGEGVGEGVLWLWSASGCQCRLLQQLPRGSQNILSNSQAGNSSRLEPLNLFWWDVQGLFRCFASFSFQNAFAVAYTGLRDKPCSRIGERGPEITNGCWLLRIGGAGSGRGGHINHVTKATTQGCGTKSMGRGIRGTSRLHSLP